MIYGCNNYQKSYFIFTEKDIKDLAYFVEDRFGKIFKYDEEYKQFYMLEGGTVVFHPQEVIKL
jgi:hypothetical protein